MARNPTQVLTLLLRRRVNPPHIPKPPLIRILKHLLHTRIRLVLRLRHYDADSTRRPRRLIPPRPIVPVLRHGGRSNHARRRDTPVNVAVGLNRVVKAGVGEDGAMQCVPGAAEGAFACYGEGGVCFLDGRVVDVNALV